MSQGMTKCPKCGREISCRGLAKHLERGCKDVPIYIPKKREKKQDHKTLGMLKQVAEKEHPNEHKDIFLPSGRTMKNREGNRKNPYWIADRFIKNCITEGVLVPDIKRLADEGRAEINLKTDHIEIKIYLAKFRKTFKEEK